MNRNDYAARWVGRSLCLSVLVAGPVSAYEFQDHQRWSTTATDGSNPTQGNPTTLTWSLVPDGTIIPNGNGNQTSSSGLIAFLDTIRGSGPGGSDLTQRPWFFVFEQSFDRFEQLSGLTINYEPNDDGVTYFPKFSSQAVGNLGVRGDIRIGGTSIDGQSNSNTLAFNYFPNFGDMVIDTDNITFYTDQSSNSIRFRNVVMHEFGHGLGIDHLISNSSGGVSGGAFLMEPTINPNFDGPQFDDILALHRGYGDFYEKSNNGNGNNTATNANNLGALNLGITKRIGTHATDTVVAATDTDFVSIDDDSDIDFFKFTISQAVFLDLTLTPKGPTYNTAPQADPGETQEPQTPFNTAALNDLTLTLIDTNGLTVLETSNLGGLGTTESILDFELYATGTYYARITGATNAAQFYQLDLLATAIPLLLGDLNGDFVIDDDDLAIVLSQFGQSATPGSLLGGDPTGDGKVGADDLNLVLANWTGSSPPPIATVPEPGSFALLAGLLGLTLRRRRALG